LKAPGIASGSVFPYIRGVLSRRHPWRQREDEAGPV
jgi:hypothetical protein